jgi:hypothetical protein
MSTTEPGLREHTSLRTLLRVVGVVLLLAPATWCLRAGFLGVGLRYVAGETTPVIKDSASCLTNGEGILGVGRTVDDRSGEAAETGPFCTRCGTRSDAAAGFCDHCGHALAG